MGTLFNDIKYALRQLRKSPGFKGKLINPVGFVEAARTARSNDPNHGGPR